MNNVVSILVADDEVASTLRDTYTAEGFDVVIQLTPNAAENYLRDHAGLLDVVILDLWMNWKGAGALDRTAGITILHRIKTEIDPNLGVVILTGHGDTPRQECLEKGAIAFVGKGLPETYDLLDKGVAQAAVTSLRARLDSPSDSPEGIDLADYVANLQARLAQAEQFAASVGVSI